MNIGDKFPKNQIYIAGDFSLSHAIWNDSSSLSASGCGQNEAMSIESVISNFNYCGLSQKNYVYNARGSLLDLFYSTDVNVSINPTSDPLSICDNYYPALDIKISVFSRNRLSSTELVSYKFGFRRANYTSISEYLNSIYWDGLHKDACLNETTELLYRHLYIAIDLFVPKIACKKSSFPKWFSPQLTDLVKQSKLSHRKYKFLNSLTDFFFSTLRSKCKSLVNECYKNYVDNIELLIGSGNDIKPF